MDRREFITATSSVTISGCLRLSERANTTEERTNIDSGLTDASQASSGQYDVSRFYLDNFDDDELRDKEVLNARADGSRVEVSGLWEGDEKIMSRQACARYSFKLLEGDSVFASSGEQIIIGYQYVISQSADKAFVTYHPSVGEDWDRTLRLTYPGGEYEVTPDILASDGVFALDFDNADIEPGRYNWLLELTPPDGFTIEIGTFNDELLSVDSSDGSSFPSRAEAIRQAGAVSNPSATTVRRPQQLTGDGLDIESSGHSGSPSSETKGRFIRRNLNINCTPTQTFGGDGDRRFRINNLTSDTSLTFTPA